MLQREENEPLVGDGDCSAAPDDVSSTIEFDLPSLRNASLQLLQHSKISRVICVDDCYMAVQRSVEEVVAALKAGFFSPEDLSVMAGVSADLSQLAEAELPMAVAVSLLEDSWLSLSDASQQKIIGTLDARVEPEALKRGPGQDVDAADRLRALLERPDAYLTLTLREWRTRKADLLADGKSTLVLFDRDFSREGAASNAGEDEIQALLAQLPVNWRIGLLTHTVLDSNDEVETWWSLSGKFEVNSSRFLVIAKGRLAENPQDFPRMLKLTLLAPALDTMKKHVHDAVKDAWQQAHERTHQIDPYTLEAALTGDRVRDGAWGPDTLLRVTSAFIQERIRAGLRGNAELHDSNTLITSLSKVKLAAIPDLDRVRKQLAQIERLEYYDSSEHLNELYFPIEAGDIFELHVLDARLSVSESDVESPEDPSAASNGGKQDHFMILLAQPCDLAIRSDGERSNDLSHVRIAPLASPQDRVISHPGGGSMTAFDLPFFYGETGTGVEVKLSRQKTVPLWALDMCAFNADGRARLQVGQTVPDHVLPNLQKRFAKLQKFVDRTVKRYSEMAPDKIPEPGAQLLTTALVGTGAWPDLAARIDIGERAIQYGIKRVARLREPYRSAVLARMAQREARDAFDPSLLDKRKNGPLHLA